MTNISTIKLDANGQILGRFAVIVCDILRGKNLPCFTKHIDPKVRVIISNANKIVVTGRKKEQKKYYRHSMHLGGLKVRTYKQMFEQDPTWIIRHAVAGMLPKNRLCSKMVTRITFIK